MAYVNPLDPLTPTDLDPADEGDDNLRQIKAALIERLETLVEDVDADPLVPRSEVFGVPFYGEFNADTPALGAFGIAEKILALRVAGTTDASGEIIVTLGTVNSGSGEIFTMANCVGIFAQAQAPDIAAVTPNQAVVRDDVSNAFTLRVQNETAHAVVWNVLLVFTV